MNNPNLEHDSAETGRFNGCGQGKGNIGRCASVVVQKIQNVFPM
jgi:hypothetical protein